MYPNLVLRRYRNFSFTKKQKAWSRALALSLLMNPTRFERMTLRLSWKDWNLTRYRCAMGPIYEVATRGLNMILLNEKLGPPHVFLVSKMW
jgi:hypothetical protein